MTESKITDTKECAICRDELKDTFVTDCSHKFCRECIKSWFFISNTCPICRKVLVGSTFIRDSSSFEISNVVILIGLLLFIMYNTHGIITKGSPEPSIFHNSIEYFCPTQYNQEVYYVCSVETGVCIESVKDKGALTLPAINDDTEKMFS